MGLSASAHLVWGIPVEAVEPFWNEDDEDWVEPDGLEVFTGGGYDWDRDDQPAILTFKGVYHYDSYDEATRVPVDGISVTHGVVAQANRRAEAADFDVDFMDARWYLIASYG